MLQAWNWFLNTLSSFLSSCNFAINLGNYNFGFLDFIVVTFLLGVIIRNFVHIAR